MRGERGESGERGSVGGEGERVKEGGPERGRGDGQREERERREIKSEIGGRQGITHVCIQAVSSQSKLD